MAFETLYERLFINHKKMKLLWAKTQLNPDEISKKKVKSEKPDLETSEKLEV